jgi:hypothetical protein
VTLFFSPISLPGISVSYSRVGEIGVLESIDEFQILLEGFALEAWGESPEVTLFEVFRRLIRAGHET